jgi:hypothetical protein
MSGLALITKAANAEQYVAQVKTLLLEIREIQGKLRARVYTKHVLQ